MKYQKPLNETSDDAPYVNANLSEGIGGSIPPAEAIEHPMREIVNVIKQAGLTPNQDNLGQLNEAINAIVQANSVTDLGALATKDSVGTTDINNEAITLSKLKTVADNANKLIGYDGNGVPVATELTAAKTDGSNIDKSSFLSSLGFSGQSLGTNGYYKFPNGLIIQWGFKQNTADSGNPTTVYFPIAFPHNVLNISLTKGSSAAFSILPSQWYISNKTSSSFTTFTSTKYMYWLAIGY
jgi:hypothetical protein